MKEFAKLFCLGIAAATVSLAAPAVSAQDCDAELPVVVRQTVPHPRAVARQPITSDRLSTTSTRLIDARRGFRPYHTAHRTHRPHRSIGPSYYDDHFGIIRPGSRGRIPTSPESVTTHRNTPAATPMVSATQDQPAPVVVIVRDEHVQPQAQPAAVMRVRIHNDEPVLPVHEGAVIIAADGTVYQLGD